MGGRLLERPASSDLVEAIPADDQLAGFAVDVAQGRLGGDDPFKSEAHDTIPAISIDTPRCMTTLTDPIG
jgi:hypothetical protein